MSTARQASYSPSNTTAAATTATHTSYKNSETSRLLCAAAYLDRQFRDLVIKSCLENRHKAMAPNFGVDMATVVSHCEKARRLLDSRELWLLVPGIVLLIVTVNNMQATVITESQAAQTIGILLLMYVVGFAICLWFKSRARAMVTKNFLRGKFNPDATLEEEDAAVAHIQAAETGNVVIYSGFTPFVGSGENMAGWSFALDLSKPAGENEDLPTVVPIGKQASLSEGVTLEALYACVAQNIEALHLERVTVEDKLYVNGRDIRNDKRFLANPVRGGQLLSFDSGWRTLPRGRSDEPILQPGTLFQNAVMDFHQQPVFDFVCSPCSGGQITGKNSALV
jgi:hypothetical protein